MILDDLWSLFACDGGPGADIWLVVPVLVPLVVPVGLLLWLVGKLVWPGES